MGDVILEAVNAKVISVSLSLSHGFSKQVQPAITLLAGLGVEGDAHCGATVRHRYRVRKDPTAPNLCQVHLIHGELLDELAARGLLIQPGEMGENVTTRGIDLLSLGRGTRLHLGGTAVVEITGLRDPCSQMNALQPGLMKACLGRAADGRLERKAGIMGIVVAGGEVCAGDAIAVDVAEGEPRPLYPV